MEQSVTEHASDTDVARMAVRAALTVGLRGIGVRSVQLGGTLVLAAILAPRQFGVIAFGLASLTAATFVSDAGLGASLIRRREPPETADFATLLTLQLAASFALAVVAWCLVPFGGESALVAAVMISALPLYAFRAPTLVRLERALTYTPIAVSELAETVLFFAWACAGAAFGLGVWAVSTAAIGRAVLGTGLLIWMGRGGVLRPRFSVAHVRSMLGFGLRYSAVSGILVVRDQGLNFGIAAAGGLTTLGLWALGYRIMQVPFLIFSALWRVSFPAMARASASGAKEAVSKAVALTAVGSGLLLVPLAVLSPKVVTELLGAHWTPSGDVAVIASVALAFSGPISVASIGYLFSKGEADAVLRVVTLSTATWLVVAIPLVPFVGVRAAALGWAISSVVEAVGFSSAVRRSSNVSVLAAVWRPAGFASVLIIASVTLTRITRMSLGATAVVALAATLVYLFGCLALDIGRSRRWMIRLVGPLRAASSHA